MAYFEFELARVQRHRGQLARAFLACAFILSTPIVVMAQEPAGVLLPGGATSLQETHGDWSVQCQVRQEPDAESVRMCALSQHQSNNQGQTVLSIQLQPNDAGASGALLLPFGLAVSQTVTLQIDEHEAESPVPFSTCLPNGCVVPLTLDAEMLERMTGGSELSISVQSSQGQDTSFTVSLRGHTAAFARTQTLLQ